MVSKPPKHYARLIRDYVKGLPDQYAEDPSQVQQALGLSDEEFELGLTFCIAKRVIVLEKQGEAKPPAAEVTAKKLTTAEVPTVVSSISP
jgi:hypothetical protein